MDDDEFRGGPPPTPYSSAQRNPAAHPLRVGDWAQRTQAATDQFPPIPLTDDELRPHPHRLGPNYAIPELTRP